MESYIKALELVDESQLNEVAVLIKETVRNGGKVFIAGNGGSYCIAHHLAADLLWGSAHPMPRSTPIIALGGNAGSMTALANDVSYEHIFSYEAIWYGMGKRDLLIVFSVSGRSKNILRLLYEARKQKTKAIVFVGQDLPNYLWRFRPGNEPGHSSSTPVVGSVLVSIDSGIDVASVGYFGVVESVFSCCCHDVALRYHALK